MVKRIQKVTKSRITKKRKNIIVVGTEGKNNKTEENYLRNLERTQQKYHFIFASGNETDPVKIVRNTIKKAKAEELSYKDGDLAVSIFDLDLDWSKEQQLSHAKELAALNNIVLITSNPCFEIWYLEHFRYTSKPFSSNAELIKELKKYLQDYEKRQTDFAALYPLTEVAINNCECLDNYQKSNNSQAIMEFCNPRTDVYKLVRMILKNNE